MLIKFCLSVRFFPLAGHRDGGISGSSSRVGRDRELRVSSPTTLSVWYVSGSTTFSGIRGGRQTNLLLTPNGIPHSTEKRACRSSCGLTLAYNVSPLSFSHFDSSQARSLWDIKPFLVPWVVRGYVVHTHNLFMDDRVPWRRIKW